MAITSNIDLTLLSPVSSDTETCGLELTRIQDPLSAMDCLQDKRLFPGQDTWDDLRRHQIGFTIDVKGSGHHPGLLVLVLQIQYHTVF